MTIFKHELKLGRNALIVWSVAISFLLVVCVLMFPEMKGEMAGVSALFSSMGSFTEAFGMDRLNFGEFLGFYGVECGNVLGLGGALFASLIGVSALSKEEKEHTADFLLTHPVSRKRVVTEKLLAVLVQILLLNLLVLLLAIGSTVLIGEEPEWSKLFLLHFAYFLVQIEIALLCFGISAFLRGTSLRIGLGIAVLMYFLNLIANISDQAEFLKYITPFGYAEGADLISSGHLNGSLLLMGAIYSAAATLAAYVKYLKKDIF